MVQEVQIRGPLFIKESGGKKGRISEQDAITYVNNNPNFILSEMGKHFSMSAPGPLYWLRKLGFSYKKKPSLMWKRAKKNVKDIPPESLVYIDESGIELTICKDRGWGKKSEKLASKKSGKYYERINIIAVYVNNKSIELMVFNGSCNTKLFETWVEQFLVQELTAGQFVVMDKASFHRSIKTKELIESVGCKVIFLLP